MLPPTQSEVCEICGSRDTQFLFNARDKNRKVDHRLFRLIRCRTCGVGFTRPKLSGAELAAYYPREYYSLDDNVNLERALRRHNRARVQRIKRFINGGKLLDIGAGTGMFLKAARESGFEVHGLEISGEAARFGRDTWRLDIRTGDLHATTLPANTYDVVTLGHVFEHLPEPRAAAQRLYSVLKPGGLVVIAVPNFDSIQARLFRAAWFHLDIPRHLFHYTPSVMERIMTNTGFKILDLNFFSRQHNWAGILGSVMELSRPGESFFHKLIRKTIGVPASKLLAYIESVLGRGGTFELYALKE